MRIRQTQISENLFRKIRQVQLELTIRENMKNGNKKKKITIPLASEELFKRIK